MLTYERTVYFIPAWNLIGLGWLDGQAEDLVVLDLS